MTGVPLVAAVSNSTAPVHINVGGTTYTSCLETLTKHPHSKLAKLFNGTTPVVVDPTKNRYFLDRDGLIFRHVLNFLRNGELELPDNFNELNLLMKEAIFFEMEDLQGALRNIMSESQVEKDQSSDLSEGESSVEEGNGVKKRARKRNKKQRARKECLTAADKGTEEIQSEQIQETDDQTDLSEEGDVQRQTNRENNKEKKKKKQREINELENDEDNEDKENIVVSSASAKPPIREVNGNEFICVVTDYQGRVDEVWCSDKEFTFELPTLLKLLRVGVCYLPLLGSTQVTFGTVTIKCGKCDRDVYGGGVITNGGIYLCQPCYPDFELKRRTNGFSQTETVIPYHEEPFKMPLPWVASYILKRGYRLVTSTTFRQYSNYNCQSYHCFVN